MKSSIMATCGLLAIALIELPSMSRAALPIYGQDRCGGPPAGWGRQGIEARPSMRKNSIELGRGTILWNGVPQKARTVLEFLASVHNMKPQPVTIAIIRPDADCGRVAVVRRMMDIQLRCSATNRCIEYSKPEWVARATN